MTNDFKMYRDIPVVGSVKLTQLPPGFCQLQCVECFGLGHLFCSIAVHSAISQLREIGALDDEVIIVM